MISALCGRGRSHIRASIDMYELKARNKAKGWRQVTVWTGNEHQAEQVKALAKKLRSGEK